MPDAFFQKKRKRTTTSSSSAGPSRGSGRAGPSRSKPSSSSTNSRSRMRSTAHHANSTLDNDHDDDDDDAVPGGGIDEMDLTHSYDQGPNSDDEADAAETPAEARVRLAKMYLQGLSSATSAPTAGADGQGDDFFESDDAPTFGLADAAQADRDNIAARLQKDVAEQSGKLHLFLSQRLAPPSSLSSLPEGTADATVSLDDSLSILSVRGHRLSVTSAVASSDAKWLFTASKDGSIIRWRLRDGKMVRVLPKRARVLDEDGEPVAPTGAGRSKSSGAARRRARMTAACNGKGRSKDASSASYIRVGQDQGHTDEVWSLSLSSDGEYLASGGKDRRVCIWAVNAASSASERFVKALGGHKDAISALSFRAGSHELYTASLDRTLKVYDVSQLSYVETLFGHQEPVVSLSCLGAETALSAGGRDRTCRYWKIRDESQLVFRAGIKSKLRQVLEGGDLSSHGQGEAEVKGKLANPTEAVEGSVEVVSMIDSHHFVSGGDSGNLSLWNLGKKKPIYSVAVAHGFEVTHSETEGEIRSPRWITSLAALPYSDVFASGSWDGVIRIWGLITTGGQVKAFRPLFTLPAPGCVNSLQLVSPPLSTVVLHTETNSLTTTAVNPQEWKHSLSHSQPSSHNSRRQVGKKLDRLSATKDNCPPLVIAALGKEHRFGRWLTLDRNETNVRNQTLVAPLRLSPSATHQPNKKIAPRTTPSMDAFKLV